MGTLHASFTFEPLIPSAFLRRAAAVAADRLALLDRSSEYTHEDLSNACGTRQHRDAGARDGGDP